MHISAAQCRAARALLNWTREELAVKAQIARATVGDFEWGRRTPIPQNRVALIAALEAGGVAFIPENRGGGAGVRLRKLELEYNRDLAPESDGLSLGVRFRDVAYRAHISREVLNDLGRTTYRDFAERVKAVGIYLPLLLRAIEAKLAAGEGGGTQRLVIDHTALPEDAF